MASIMKSLGIDRLSIEDRILLAEEIWNSLPECSDEAPITDARKAELDRRLADHEADPQAGSTWEEVKARLRADL